MAVYFGDLATPNIESHPSHLYLNIVESDILVYKDLTELAQTQIVPCIACADVHRSLKKLNKNKAADRFGLTA